METLSHGAWRSPITSDLIVAETIGLGGVLVDGGDIYWTESRPSEGGRNVLVLRTRDGGTTDLMPPPFNVVALPGWRSARRTDGYFSNFADQRSIGWRSAAPVALTPEAAARAGATPMRF
jgi:hypothetical protein